MKATNFTIADERYWVAAAEVWTYHLGRWLQDNKMSTSIPHAFYKAGRVLIWVANRPQDKVGVDNAPFKDTAAMVADIQNDMTSVSVGQEAREQELKSFLAFTYRAQSGGNSIHDLALTDEDRAIVSRLREFFEMLLGRARRMSASDYMPSE